MLPISLVLVLALVCYHATAAPFSRQVDSVTNFFEGIKIEVAQIDTSKFHFSVTEPLRKQSKNIQEAQNRMKQSIDDVFQPEKLEAIVGNVKAFSKEKWSAAQNLLKEHPEVSAWIQDEAVPALDKFAVTMQQGMKTAKETLLQVEWESMPEEIKEYVLAHPGEVAFYTASGVLFIAPGLLYGPVLGALGWTSIGPAAASSAATLQSSINPVAAGGMFATLQSAQMGGFGAAVLAQVARVAIVAAVGGKLGANFVEGLNSE